MNVGCIPSKALLHAAKVIEDAHDMAANGISFGPPAIDYDKLRAWKNKVVGRLVNGVTGLAKQRKVEVIRGEAKFVDFPHVGNYKRPTAHGGWISSNASSPPAPSRCACPVFRMIPV